MWLYASSAAYRSPMRGRSGGQRVDRLLDRLLIARRSLARGPHRPAAERVDGFDDGTKAEGWASNAPCLSILLITHNLIIDKSAAAITLDTAW